MKLDAAFATNMINSKDISVIMKSIVRDENSKTCMYRNCSNCKDRVIPYNPNVEDLDAPQVVWQTWKTKSEQIGDGNTAKIVTKTVKEQDQGTRKVLAEEINSEMQRACRHIFNIRNQYRTLRYLKTNLTHEEIIAHIDFSENYCCKYSQEIQSMHFGGSQNLLSLHTGVLYMKDQMTTFCSVSDCLRHDPAAIWVHLHPVLEFITGTNSHLTTIHFISDGPTTQYRNKQNFYLWAKKISNYGFKKSTWNFLEASHGKEAADGLGAAVKRAADQHVIVNRKDVTCAQEFVNTKSTVKLFLVNMSAIQTVDTHLPSNLHPIPSTMKLHQVSCSTWSTVHFKIQRIIFGSKVSVHKKVLNVVYELQFLMNNHFGMLNVQPNLFKA